MSRPIVLNATSPYEKPLNRVQQKVIWDNFLNSGSAHSAQAATLPYIMRRCEIEGIAYKLYAHPGQAYFIEKEEK